jgi:hypothetical protein
MIEPFAGGSGVKVVRWGGIGIDSGIGLDLRALRTLPMRAVLNPVMPCPSLSEHPQSQQQPEPSARLGLGGCLVCWRAQEHEGSLPPDKITQ